MSQEQFDKIINDKLQELHYVPTEAKWEALQAQWSAASANAADAGAATTGKQPDTGLYIASNNRAWKKIAAVLLPLIGVGIALLYKQQHPIVASHDTTIPQSTEATLPAQSIAATTQPHNTIENTSTPQAQENTATAQNNTVATYTTAAPSNSSYNAPSNSRNNITSNHVANNIAANNNANASNKNIATQNNLPQHTVAPNHIAQEPSSNTNANSTTNNTALIQNPPPAKKEQQFLPQYNNPPTPPAVAKLNKAMRYSVALGAHNNQYATASNSISLAINAEKPLSKYVYVEGNIGVASNNPSWLQNATGSGATNSNAIASAKSGYQFTSNSGASNGVNVYGVDETADAFRAGGNNIPLADITDNNSISAVAVNRIASTQVEANPMVGIAPHKKLRIAGGFEAARIITGTKYNEAIKSLQLQTRNQLQVQNWDMGAVAKVEYIISNSIAVGYRHRTGVTNMAPTAATAQRRNYNGVALRVRLH